MLGYLINFSRDIVLPFLVSRTESMLDRAENARRDAWLASAADIGELERRMRAVDIES
ncbi:hypothetical protein AWB80_00975 [Caballeronia pedi]|uniref:Uncharacterized protein n=2 Tax=Caballeronia pedi TaxID=1777141 RepID=A0A157ZK24_9BURK|nr:hypothetical protein AWB80_00975 [Caballeronia pedi]